MRLYCSIVVDRDTHKPIVLGRGGARIKRIGVEARTELERLFGVRVYLDLHVRGAAGLARERAHAAGDGSRTLSGSPAAGGGTDMVQ